MMLSRGTAVVVNFGHRTPNPGPRRGIVVDYAKDYPSLPPYSGSEFIFVRLDDGDLYALNPECVTCDAAAAEVIEG